MDYVKYEKELHGHKRLPIRMKGKLAYGSVLGQSGELLIEIY
jgi:hypothetical protein